jgi:threonine dehydratase
VRHDPISLVEIKAARERIAGRAVRTPLVRLNVDNAPAEIYLKLENLQPIGSFKIRGAVNALKQMKPSVLSEGIWTASAGNMALGAAWCARQMGLRCTVVVPDTAPEAKLAALRRLGASIVPVSVDEFFETFSTRRREGMQGAFLHAFSDRQVMAGNGTIGLEILEDLPVVDAILVPFGGGGLSCGIASAVRAAGSKVKVFACEPEPASPLTRSFGAGREVEGAYQRSFIDGAGAPHLYPEMYELASRLLDGSFALAVDAVADAVRLLAERSRVVAEGAGALPVAAALEGRAGRGRVCCVVSGGNIDSAVLASILQGTFATSMR